MATLDFERENETNTEYNPASVHCWVTSPGEEATASEETRISMNHQTQYDQNIMEDEPINDDSTDDQEELDDFNRLYNTSADYDQYIAP